MERIGDIRRRGRRRRAGTGPIPTAIQEVDPARIRRKRGFVRDLVLIMIVRLAGEIIIIGRRIASQGKRCARRIIDEACPRITPVGRREAARTRKATRRRGIRVLVESADNIGGGATGGNSGRIARVIWCGR